MLIFLKLGGSLITDKDIAYTARHDVIKRIAEEIKRAMDSTPDLKLVVGHGSGSFGHFAAIDSGYKENTSSKKQWHAFHQVWIAAHNLNYLIVDILIQSGLPVLSFPPSAAILSEGNKVKEWNTKTIQLALENNLIPVIYGDIILDQTRGSRIFSTEELFLYLINPLNPDKILLAGKEPGVWADFPNNRQLISKITPGNFEYIKNEVTASQSMDVTGGMHEKVTLMLNAVKKHPNLAVEILTGEASENIYKSLTGSTTGTSIAYYNK
jgi:isopentenyl phosphate kinase